MYITLQIIEILRWGFICSTSMALNCLLRWFMMVLVVFGFSPILVHIPATAVPGKYQWGCLPLSKSNMSTQYLVTQAPPYHCTVPAFNGTSGSHLVPAPPPHSPPLKPVQTVHRLLCSHQTVIQAVQMWIYWERGFPSTQYKLAQLVPRCYKH